VVLLSKVIFYIQKSSPNKLFIKTLNFLVCLQEDSSNLSFAALILTACMRPSTDPDTLASRAPTEQTNKMSQVTLTHVWHYWEDQAIFTFAVSLLALSDFWGKWKQQISIISTEEIELEPRFKNVYDQRIVSILNVTGLYLKDALYKISYFWTIETQVTSVH